MAVTSYATMSETVSTTEWSLTTDTAGPDSNAGNPGYYQPVIDFGLMTAYADEFCVRIYDRVLVTGARQVIFQANLAGPQYGGLWIGPALMLLHDWDITVQKIGGTDRLLDASVRKLADAEEVYGNSETVTTTEWSMASDAAFSGATPKTDDEIIQLFVGIAAIAAVADDFSLKLYEKVRSGDTQRIIWKTEFVTPSPPVMVTPPLVLLHGWDATLLKNAGTDRSMAISFRHAM